MQEIPVLLGCEARDVRAESCCQFRFLEKEDSVIHALLSDQKWADEKQGEQAFTIQLE